MGTNGGEYIFILIFFLSSWGRVHNHAFSPSINNKTAHYS